MNEQERINKLMKQNSDFMVEIKELKVELERANLIKFNLERTLIANANKAKREKEENVK